MRKSIYFLMKACIITIVLFYFINLGYLMEVLKYEPSELIELSSGGIRALKKEKDLDSFYLKTKSLTANQKKRLERLRSLGYAMTSSEIADINPVLNIPIILVSVNEIIIKTSNINKNDFAIRLSINNNKEECLYHKEMSEDSLLNHIKRNKGFVTFNSNLRNLDEPLIITLEFKSCDLSISEIHIR